MVSFALVGVIIIFAVVLVMYSIYLFHKDRKVRGRSNDWNKNVSKSYIKGKNQ